MRFKVLVLFLLLLPLSTTISAQDVSYFKGLDFNPVAHPNIYLAWPHSANPALLGQEDLLAPRFLDEPESYTLALGDRNSTYPLEGNGEYALDTIPEGLYDLILYDGEEVIDIQTHAVKIYEQMPESIKFVQITDTHLPSYSGDIETTEIISQIFSNITLEDPDFVLLTGDFIEAVLTYKQNETGGQLITFEELMVLGLEFLDLWDLPIFVIPGNHDIMTILPTRESSENLWYSYMAPEFIQSFDIGLASFIGFGSGDKISQDQLQQAVDTANVSNKPIRILYTHYDYQNQISSRQHEMNLSMVIQGHMHTSKIERKGGVLWVQTHNAYQPDQYEPKTGYRVFSLNEETGIDIDSEFYEFRYQSSQTTEGSTDPSDTSASEVYFPSFLLVGILMINLVRRKCKC